MIYSDYNDTWVERRVGYELIKNMLSNSFSMYIMNNVLLAAHLHRGDSKNQAENSNR